MENDNSSDQFLALQSLNTPGNIMALSPPSNNSSVHLQELSTGNSQMAGSGSGTLLGKYHQIFKHIFFS